MAVLVRADAGPPRPADPLEEDRARSDCHDTHSEDSEVGRAVAVVAVDVNRPGLLRRALVEALAAFVLVFAGCGAIVTESMHPGALGSSGVAAVFGLVVVGLVYATGHLSGAHVNPAVTVAFVITRHFPAREAMAYVAAQLVGATAGAEALALVWSTRPDQLGATVPTASPTGAILYEAAFTAILMFVITSVATDTRAVGAGAALAIGATVAMGALIAGPVSGASFNPARSFGPALVTDTWSQFWIYVAGPVIGAVVGAALYEGLRAPRDTKPRDRTRRTPSLLDSGHRGPPRPDGDAEVGDSAAAPRPGPG